MVMVVFTIGTEIQMYKWHTLLKQNCQLTRVMNQLWMVKLVRPSIKKVGRFIDPPYELVPKIYDPLVEFLRILSRVALSSVLR